MEKFTINNNTKKIIAIFLCVLLILTIAVGGFFGGYTVHKKMTEQYNVDVIVTEVIPDTNEVFFETTSGHVFYIVTDEIFASYEEYTITFKTNGTATVEDDEIYHISRNIEMSIS